MGKVEESREESSRAVWVTPTLSELDVGQTLTGATEYTAELYDSDRNPITHS